MQHLLVRAETMDGLDQVRLEAHARPRAGNGPGRLTLGNSPAGLQLLMMNVRGLQADWAGQCYSVHLHECGLGLE